MKSKEPKTVEAVKETPKAAEVVEKPKAVEPIKSAAKPREYAIDEPRDGIHPSRLRQVNRF
jgi:hypothetical protein